MSLTIGGQSSPKANQKNLKQDLLKKILASGLQVSKETLNFLLQQENPEEAAQKLILEAKQTGGLLIIPKNSATTISTNPQPAQQTQQIPTPQQTTEEKLRIINNYIDSKPIESIKDTAKYFTMRFNQYRRYLQNRLSNLQSIAGVKKLNNEKISVIGIIYDKRKTQKGNTILELEDLSGTVNCIISKKEVLSQAEDLIFDEVIGITGTASKGMIFVDEITQPDLPIKRETKNLSSDVYAAFLSDIHVGSKKFLGDKFERMLSFLKGQNKSEFSWGEQADAINKLKYIFVAGDIVDGIGVYPGQEKEINIKDIYDQYKTTAKLFAKIPEHIQIVMCPGNHDYVRLAQPQPPIGKETAPDLYELPNVTLISSPGVVKIKPTDNNGLDVLLYHGTSIDTIVPQNPHLKDGYKHPEKVMVTLLKKRHLSPQYESGIVTTEFNSDPLAIPDGIDIIHTGHVHSNGAINYRGVTLINSGTWQDTTEFQKFLGHEPTPGRTPFLNLKTRQIKLFEF